MTIGAWINETFATYFNNATAQRDFRVQLRGGRSVLLFSMYLGLLILVGMFVYSQTSGLEEISVVEAQDRLRGFYDVIMILLGTTVVLVAPALTATTVVMEKQRKSLDLVFSAPVLPKYYLVGKMISSFRYTWMLLVLALPVTATCVILGGASWGDVLVAYLLLSLQALILTSAALLMSTLAPKPVSAIVWSYALAIVFLIVTAIPGGASAYAGTGREASFFGCLNPFFSARTTDTYTLIFSTEVPNWILVGAFALLLSKLFVLTAGSVLAPFGASKDVPSLRVHMLVYTVLLASYFAYVATGPLGMMRTSGSGFAEPGSVLGLGLFLYLSPMFVFLPFLSCYGIDAESRFWPNGTFKVKKAFDGTPAGAMPYIGLVIIATALAIAGGYYWGTGNLPTVQFASYTVFALGFWTFFWAVGRFTSALILGVRSARTLQFAVFLVLAVLPVPFLSAIQSAYYMDTTTPATFWELYVLRPLWLDSDRSLQGLLYGAIMLGGGYLLARVAEERARQKLSTMRTNDGRTYAAA